MRPDPAEEARTMVAAVRHDPALRVELASRFYDDRPGRASIRAYRRAELAFMRWQVSRGVLAPPESARPGSQWWRSVNESLLRDACEAGRLAAGRAGQASTPAVARWAGFLTAPSPRTWYRAHNASIVAAYLEHRHLCAADQPHPCLQPGASHVFSLVRIVRHEAPFGRHWRPARFRWHTCPVVTHRRAHLGTRWSPWRLRSAHGGTRVHVTDGDGGARIRHARSVRCVFTRSIPDGPTIARGGCSGLCACLPRGA